MMLVDHPKRATLTDVWWWILETWMAISQDMIAKTSKYWYLTRGTGMRMISFGISFM
jgi:hypothetical protein